MVFPQIASPGWGGIAAVLGGGAALPVGIPRPRPPGLAGPPRLC